MFVTDGQLSYFLFSLAVGAALGVIKGFFPVRGRTAHLFDLLFSLFAFLVFFAAEYLLRFPAFRPYMAAGVGVGFVIVRKIFSQTVAKVRKRWYNRKKRSADCAKKEEEI